MFGFNKERFAPEKTFVRKTETDRWNVKFTEILFHKNFCREDSGYGWHFQFHSFESERVSSLQDNFLLKNVFDSVIIRI